MGQPQSQRQGVSRGQGCGEAAGGRKGTVSTEVSTESSGLHETKQRLIPPTARAVSWGNGEVKTIERQKDSNFKWA